MGSGAPCCCHWFREGRQALYSTTNRSLWGQVSYQKKIKEGWFSAIQIVGNNPSFARPVLPLATASFVCMYDEKPGAPLADNRLYRIENKFAPRFLHACYCRCGQRALCVCLLAAMVEHLNPKFKAFGHLLYLQVQLIPVQEVHAPLGAHAAAFQLKIDRCSTAAAALAAARARREVASGVHQGQKQSRGSNLHA